MIDRKRLAMEIRAIPASTYRKVGREVQAITVLNLTEEEVSLVVEALGEVQAQAQVKAQAQAQVQAQVHALEHAIAFDYETFTAAIGAILSVCIDSYKQSNLKKPELSQIANCIATLTQIFKEDHRP